jgi:hypothetical protein
MPILRAALVLALLALLLNLASCAVAFNVAIGNTATGALPVAAPELLPCRPLDSRRPLP